MCLDTFSSIPSKDGPIVPKRQGGGRAKIMGRKNKNKKQKKKTGAVHNGLIEENETGREMYQKAFLSEPTSRHHLRKVSR